MPAALLGPIAGPTVLGAGTAFPPLELDNLAVLKRIAALSGRRPTDAQLAFAAEALESEHGLSRRAWCHEVGRPLDHARELTSADLGAQAAERALAAANVQPGEIRALFCATSSPHRMTATVSAAIAARLGLSGVAMDVRAGCAAGLFALSNASLHVAAGVSPVLVVATETFSKVIPPQHKDAVVSLADGAAALVLGPGRGALLAASLETDGNLGHLVNTPGPMPPTVEDVEAGRYLLDGAPEGLKSVIPARYLAALQNALAHARLAPGELDAYVPHQVGKQVGEWVVAQLGLPRERAWLRPERHGNVGAAGALVALAEAREAGWCQPGQRVALAAVGGGMSWAALILRM